MNASSVHFNKQNPGQSLIRARRPGCRLIRRLSLTIVLQAPGQNPGITGAIPGYTTGGGPVTTGFNQCPTHQSPGGTL